MNIVRFVRASVAACICALGSACSGATLTPAVPASPQQTAEIAEPQAHLDAKAAREAAAGAELLYVSDVPALSRKGTVNIYLANFFGRYPLVGQITGLDEPWGLAITRDGTLYVVQKDPGAPILVFPFAATRPSLKLDTQGAEVTSVALLPNGDVVAASAGGGAFVGVMFYKRGATAPYRKVPGRFGDGISSIATDSDGDIYVHYANAGFGFPVAELTDDSNGIAYNVAAFFSNPLLTVIDDSGNLILQNTAPRSEPIDIYPPGSKTKHSYIANKLLLQSATLDAGGTVFYAGEGSIFVYAYPKGTPIATITARPSDNTFGMVTFPARPLPPPWRE